MSDLTPCNYCNFHRIVDTKDKLSQAILEPGRGPAGGQDLYVRPVDEKLDREKHWVAWFMELTDHCVC